MLLLLFGTALVTPTPGDRTYYVTDLPDRTHVVTAQYRTVLVRE